MENGWGQTRGGPQEILSNGGAMLKRDIRAMENIVSNLNRGLSFLMSPDILVCRRGNYKTTTLDFINDKGEICHEIDKEIGSELALVHTGMTRLHEFMANH
jgi:hypothetical protein